jgi:hypothetical protein
LRSVGSDPTSVIPDLPNQAGLLSATDVLGGMRKTRRVDAPSKICQMKWVVGSMN